MPQQIDNELVKQEGRIFVIMPFRQANARNADQLTAFFENNLKRPIEQDDSFRFRYRVHRSSQEFNINNQIIRELFHADAVVCDLSGRHGNSNVMYELGVRLTSSRKPVILIREDHPENETIFDIAGYHTFLYDPLIPSGATDYIRRKLSDFEGGREPFESPVLQALESEIPFMRMSKERAVDSLTVLEVGLLLSVQAFASGINDYLSRIGDDFRLSLAVNAINDEVSRERERLFSVDWSGIQLILGPHPALFNYLSTNYLGGLVERGLEVDFSVELMRYHSRYFLEATWWLRFDIGRGMSFVHYTYSVAQLCRLMTTLLLADRGPQYEAARADLNNFIARLRSVNWEG